MKKINFIFFLFSCFLFLTTISAKSAHTATEYHILATTFPIYQITRNIIQNSRNTKIQLMLPAQLGCPHDYALTPQDIKKITNADILIINGLGMEEFIENQIKKTNSKIILIDSSAGIKKTIQYSENNCCNHNTANKQCNHHHGVNPHLFASPRMTAKLTINISAALSKANPKEAELYTKNATAYAKKMNHLANEMLNLGKRLKNNKIVEPHGVFDYLARDMNLEIVATMLAHGQQPSAAGLRYLAKIIKENKAGAIFTEPQYSPQIGITLAKETGLPVAILDPVATGPENAPLDYYETVMHRNMKTLEQTLNLK